MNKIYRIVWNPALQAWVAVSEFAKARGKGKNGRTRLTTTAAGVAGVLALTIIPLEDARAYMAGTGATDNSAPTNTAVGTSAKAIATQNATAIGNLSQASGTNSTAIGAGAKATGDNAQVFGFNAFADGVNTVAVGPGAKAQNDYAIAIGSQSEVTAIEGIALGESAQSLAVSGTGGRNIAIGKEALASSNGTGNNIAFGSYASATGPQGSIAIGEMATSSGSGSLSFGYHTLTQGSDALAMTASAKALQRFDIAVGVAAQAGIGTDGTSAGYNIALGRNTLATGGKSLALGNDSQSTSSESTAIGNAANASGVKSIAIGSSANALGTQSISIGTGNIVSGGNSGAFGDPSTISGTGSYSIGNNNNIASDNAFVVGNNVTLGSGTNEAIALGNNAQVTTAGGVALGAGSNATRGPASSVYVPTATPSDVAAVNATKGIRAGVDVGSRQITSVGAGSSDSDAVNVAQLKALAGNPLTFAGNTGSVAKILGSTVTIKGGKTTAGTYSDKNMNTVVDASGNLNIQMADNPVFNSVIATNGTNTTTLAATGLTVTGGPSVTTTGINAGSKKITNVADGTISSTSTDAVNGSQLNDVATNPLTFAGNTGSVAKILGSTVIIKGGKTTAGTYSDKNMNTVVDASGNLNIQMADNPVFNSVIATNGTNTTTLAATGLTVTGGPSVTTTGINAGSKKITNVADGTISSTSTDAVNGSQLNNTISRLTHYYSVNDGGVVSANYNNDGATALNALAAGVGAQATVANGVALGSGSVASTAAGNAGYLPVGLSSAAALAINATTSTLGAVSVGDAATGKFRQITGVAAGTQDSDAVNVAQLFAVSEKTDTLNDQAVKYDINTDGSVNYNHITLAGNTYDSSTHTGGTTITNVANGVNDSDAVNMSQLNATNENVTNITDTVNNFAGDQSVSYTDINGRGIRYVRTNDNGLPLTDAFANGQGSTAVGYNARSTGLSSLALGRDAQSINEGDVALGSGSVTDVAVATTGVRINDVDYVFAGINPLSTISVGSRGNERTITNLAAGRITADSTDAINGSQLYATNTAIDTLDRGAVKYDINTDVFP